MADQNQAIFNMSDPDPEPNPDQEMSDIALDDTSTTPIDTSPDSSVSPPGNTSSPPTDAPPDDTLHFKQIKYHPRKDGNPADCWSGWYKNFDNDIQTFVAMNIQQMLYLEYIVLVRTISTKPSHPEDYSAIIFMIEDCFKVRRKAVVLRVDSEILDFISHGKMLESLFLEPMGRDEGIFRESEVDRQRLFRRPFAAGRSEDKLNNVVRGFMLLDQRIDSMAVAVDGQTNGLANGNRMPVRRLANSLME
jgi:hypothetical protein